MCAFGYHECLVKLPSATKTADSCWSSSSLLPLAAFSTNMTILTAQDPNLFGSVSTDCHLRLQILDCWSLNVSVGLTNVLGPCHPYFWSWTLMQVHVGTALCLFLAPRPPTCNPHRDLSVNLIPSKIGILLILTAIHNTQTHTDPCTHLCVCVCIYIYIYMHTYMNGEVPVILEIWRM